MRSWSSLIAFDAEELLDRRGKRPLAFEQPPEFGRKGARRALAAQDVEGAVLRGGHQPRGRILRHAAEFPDLERAAEGVLHDVFCQREVVDSEDARQSGDHAPRFAPEQMIAGLHHMFIFMTGRTSTAAFDLEDRAALGELDGLLQIAGLDQRVAADDVLGLGKRAVRHGLLLALDDLAGTFERMTWLLDMPLLTKLLEPGHPFLHLLLHSAPGTAQPRHRDTDRQIRSL